MRIGIHCEVCFRFVAHGRDAGPCGGIAWIDKCDWCVEQAARRQAEVERLEAIWRARECAADDCTVVFTPARAGQRFHDERCRKRTYARTKAAGKILPSR